MGYLVISRKVGDRILVGDDVEILIAEISENKVDVAVKAPKNWKIQRQVNHITEVQNELKHKPRK